MHQMKGQHKADDFSVRRRVGLCLLVRRIILIAAAGVQHETLCGATPAGVLQKHKVFLIAVFFFYKFHFTLNYNTIS